MRSVAEQSKEHLHDVWLDDFAQKAHILRTATALGYGLDPDKYSRPFPGTQTSTTSSVEVQRTSGVGKMLAVALAGATGAGVLGTGLAGAGLAAWLALKSATTPAASDRALSDAEARARVRIFWGDSELTPEAPALETEAAP